MPKLKTLLGNLLLTYLRLFAVLQLRKNPRAVIVGVTGSVGKTTTCEAIVRILQSKGVVKSTSGANSQSGIPLSLLGIKMTNYSLFSWFKLLFLAPLRCFFFSEKYDYLVAEMGIDMPDPPGNMDYLLTILKPDIAVVTQVGPVHIGAFDHLVKDTLPKRRLAKLTELIGIEKMKLPHSLTSTGVAVLNFDNPLISRLATTLTCRVISYGSSSTPSVKIGPVQLSSRGFAVTFSYQGNTSKLVLPDLLPAEYAGNFAAAISVGISLGIPLAKSTAQLESYQSPAGRFRLFGGKNQTHLIDSTYNSSLTSLMSSLQLLKKAARTSHKIAVLGDMRELGSSTKKLHQQLANSLPFYANEAILFGPFMKNYVYPSLARQKFPVFYAPTMAELIKYLESRLRPHAWILFKSSQDQLYLERAVEAVLANRKDQSKLCRRGAYWDLLRANSK